MILERHVKVKSVATVQETQAQEGMTALILDPDDKVPARVSHTLDTALVLLVGADRKQLTRGAVFKADKALFPLGNDPQAALPERLLDVAPVGGSVSAAR